MNVQPKPKSFSWSFSKLKGYETCPRRYEAVDLLKTEEQPKSPELEQGEDLHAAMRSRVESDKKLPPHLIYMERWAEKLTRVLSPYQIIQCERMYSVDRHGEPTAPFAKDTWLRAKIDYFRLVPMDKTIDHGHVVDYKTGKMPKRWDGTQLVINAHMVFAHFKTLNKVRVDYLWTQYNDTTHATYTREQIPGEMAQLTPRVTVMEEAHRTSTFPPKPCGLCFEYCPVSSCEYYGKRLRE